jgi:hypothetical protein
MERLNPEKLHVEFREGVTKTQPVLGRRYTLTHSDLTAELFLTIGLQYAYDKITTMRDEVLGEWRTSDGENYLYVHVYVDGQFGESTAKIRNIIFVRELPLALEAIRYGDNDLFVAHPQLDNSPIWVHFQSSNPNYNRFENWGTLSDYK